MVKNNKLIYIAGGYQYYDYLGWLEDIGFEVTTNLEKADNVFFAGGADISPTLYGEKVGRYTYCDPKRDELELSIFNKSKNKLKIGVCRGGQYLTAMNGYKLVQHSSHPSYHGVTTREGLTLNFSSSHHQQFLLQENGLIEPSKYELIAWSEKISNYHLNGDDKDYNFPDDYKEPDIVVYTNKNGIKSICIQMHPEYLPLKHVSVKYCQDLVLSCLT